MQRSWGECLRTNERANLIRRLHRVWVADLSPEEVCDEMMSCPRCLRDRPGKMEGGVTCDLCGGAGIMGGFTTEIVSEMARDVGLPPVRPESAHCPYCPDEAEIRLATAKLRQRWTNAQVEASLRGTIPSGGDNARGAPET